MNIKRKLNIRFIAIFFLVQIVLQIFLPTLSYALTSGPSQPEFSSFEPVATTNMVDEFSGDFTYNLPLLEVPGPQGSSYPINLSYHSGVAPEEEASWVGLGWTLNPGAINRNTRGIPDDFNGKSIIFNNKVPTNWTATVGAGGGFGEAFSGDLTLGFNASIRFNNYRGFGYNAGLGLSIGKGVVSLGYGVTDGEGSFSLNISPSSLLNRMIGDQEIGRYKLKTLTTRDENKLPKGEESVRGSEAIESKSIKGFSSGSSYGLTTFGESTRPLTVTAYSGESYNVTFGLQKNPIIIPLGAILSLSGSYSFQDNVGTISAPAYGYLYSSSATENDVMDYHMEKESDLNKRDVFLGLPFNDADNFIVTGEGIGGGFRFYNKTVGHFGPRKVSSSTNIYNIGFEVAAGFTFGSGIDLGLGLQTLEMKDWKKDVSLFQSPTSSVDEPIFARFNNDLGVRVGRVLANHW